VSVSRRFFLEEAYRRRGGGHVRVRDLESAELRKRVQDEQAVVLRDEYPPDCPNATYLNEHGMLPGDGFISLPRDRTIQIDLDLASEQEVLPSAVLDHLVRNASHRVIANFCICRDAMECKDYPIDWGCIFLGDAAKDISPELGRAVTAEEALEYAAKCREVGLGHIVGRFKPDLNWLNEGVGPHDKLVTICNCCPCCCGMRILPVLKESTREQLIARMPGVEITIGDECTGCGSCVEGCMFKGIAIEDDRAVVNERCRICGRCADSCPVGAIHIRVVADDYVQKAISDISGRADYR
jgi:ferredoxin